MSNEFMEKIMPMVESGISPEEIIHKLNDELIVEKEHNVQEPEKFPDDIKIISQPMLFRHALQDEASDISKLINKCYIEETHGEEGFRTGDCVTEEFISNLLNDSEYQWLLVEAPNGYHIQQDGLILGLACYTTTGISRKNGEIEGHVGSIRFLCVLPRFHGLCLGLRLLQRVEKNMINNQCCRIMVSVPSSRKKLQHWLHRRGFLEGTSVSYPVQYTGHILYKPEIVLIIFHKSLSHLNNNNNNNNHNNHITDNSIDTTITSVKQIENKLNTKSTELISNLTCNPTSGSSISSSLLESSSKTINLPPQWRPVT